MLDHSIDPNSTVMKKFSDLLVALESQPKITPQNPTNVEMLYL